MGIKNAILTTFEAKLKKKQAKVQQCLAQLFGSARAQFFSLAWSGLAWHGLNVAIAQEISQLNMI